MPQTWDEKGNLISSAPSASTSGRQWDETGKPIPPNPRSESSMAANMPSSLFAPMQMNPSYAAMALSNSPTGADPHNPANMNPNALPDDPELRSDINNKLLATQMATIGGGPVMDAAVTGSVKPLVPLIRGAVGAEAGNWLGKGLGTVASPFLGSKTGAEIGRVGGALGSIAGGLYGGMGGRVPTFGIKRALMNAMLPESVEGAAAGEATAAAAPRTTPFSPPAPADSGVLNVPEPRAPIPGQNPNLMGSVPREELPGLAKRGVPGAAQQAQATGKTVLYTPQGGNYPPPRSTTVFSNKPGGSPPQTSPPTDLTAQPKVTPDTTVLPEQVKPDFTAKTLHPWQAEARIDKHVGELQGGEDATIVGRPGPGGTISTIKGYNTAAAAKQTGKPVQVVNPGPMTDGEAAAASAESHFFPQNDHAVPASLAKDAASERASLPDEIKNAPALPAKEGPDVRKIQSGTTFQTTKIPDRIRKR